DGDGAVRDGWPPDVRERVAVPCRHAAGAGLVLGAGPDRRHDAVSDLAAPGRGTPPRQEPGWVYRLPEAGPASSGAVRVVAGSVPLDQALNRAAGTLMLSGSTLRPPTPLAPGPPNPVLQRAGRADRAITRGTTWCRPGG